MRFILKKSAMVALSHSPEVLFATRTVAMSRLERGDRGRVVRVVGHGAEAARLKALGVCEGRLVEVLRTGDAWVLRVLGSRIGISRELASRVLLIAG